MRKQETLDNFIVRLDQPASGSTRFAESIELNAWLVPPSGFSAEETRRDISVRLSVSRIGAGQTYPAREMLFCGRTIGSSVDKHSAYLESLTLAIESEESNDLARTVSGSRYLISGRINVQALIPQPGQPLNAYSFCLIASLGPHVAVSNSVHVAFPPLEKFDDLYAGFLSPRTSRLRSDFLVIEGWALKQKDELREVFLRLNGREICQAATGVWSPKVRILLPDFHEADRCIFSKTLPRDGLENLGVKPDELADPLRLSAICRFASGAEFELNGPALRWLPALPDSQVRGRILGEIERVSLTQEGPLILEGWALDSGPGRPSFSVQSFRQKVELAEGGDVSKRLTSYAREDIVQEYLPWAKQSDNGFVLTLEPVLLGRFPGALSVHGENRVLNYSSPLGPESAWRLAETKLARLSPRSGPINRAKRFAAAISRCLNLQLPSAGMRAELPTEFKHEPRRILFASHNLSSVEGAPRVLARIVKAAVEKVGRPENIMVLASHEGSLRQEFEEWGVRVEVRQDLWMHCPTWEGYHSSLSSLLPLICEFKPDVLYANVLDTFWAADASYRLGLPFLWLIHESNDPLEFHLDWGPSLRTQFLHRLTHADRLVFVCEATRRLFQPYLGRRASIVIPNGVDVETIDRLKASLPRSEARASLGLAEQEIVVTIIGTTTWRKGQDVFLRGMAELKKRAPNHSFRFFVVGARNLEYLASLQRLCEELNLKPATEFISETPDVAPYYIASDVIVVASREESAPLVSLEAFAYGVPLVSTTAYGLAEQIRDKDNALAFAVDDPVGMAERILAIIDDPALAARLVENARRDAESCFSLENCQNTHWAAICDCFQTAVADYS